MLNTYTNVHMYRIVFFFTHITKGVLVWREKRLTHKEKKRDVIEGEEYYEGHRYVSRQLSAELREIHY